MNNLLNFPKEKITDDSRLAGDGWLFLSYAGEKNKNLEYTKLALSKGAMVVSIFDFPDLGSNFYYEKNLAILLEKLFPNNLKLIGITGTNGKTSVAYILQQALNNLGVKTGFIGTIGTGSGTNLTYLGYTTPPLLKLYQTLYDFATQGYSYVVMEVSSHSIAQNRIGNLKFDYAVLTNITPEHLDYHKTMTEYADTKKSFLISRCLAQVVNLDNETLTDRPYPNLLTFGLKSGELHITNRKANSFNIVLNDKVIDSPITLDWIGEFYISNFLAVLRVMIDMMVDVDISKLVSAILSAKLPKGRMELVPNDDSIKILIDFAHSPDALEKTLLAVRAYYPNQPITVVFGCGGDRDPSKRPVMGRIATSLATNVILTNDNPRYEDPTKILEEILSGCEDKSSVFVEPDRKMAIKLSLSKFRDTIIVVAGKGHEETQEISGHSEKFSDFETIKLFI